MWRDVLFAWTTTVRVLFVIAARLVLVVGVAALEGLLQLTLGYLENGLGLPVSLVLQGALPLIIDAFDIALIVTVIVYAAFDTLAELQRAVQRGRRE